MVRMFAGLFALTTLIGSVVADDKKDPQDKTAEIWEGGSNGVDLKFEVGKDTLKVVASMGCNGVNFTCKKSVDKDGVVMAEVTTVEVKGMFPAPEKGLKFTFKWKVDGDTATLSDLKGKGIEEYSNVIEGKYTKKK
jgi:hypothetical protein